MAEPMFALRLYGDAADFGVSLEVSFIERKKDEQSLQKQHKVLVLPISQPVYYFVQKNGESQMCIRDRIEEVTHAECI